jgi:hypothetical protein
MDFGRSICRSASCGFRRVLNSRLRAQANSENDGVQTCQNHPHGILFGCRFFVAAFFKRRAPTIAKVVSISAKTALPRARFSRAPLLANIRRIR